MTSEERDSNVQTQQEQRGADGEEDHLQIVISQPIEHYRLLSLLEIVSS